MKSKNLNKIIKNTGIKDQVKIKRVKRNTKPITTKQKIMAAAGLGSSALGMLQGINAQQQPQQTKIVSTVAKTDSKGQTLSDKIKATVRDFFTIPKAKADEGSAGYFDYSGEMTNQGGGGGGGGGGYNYFDSTQNDTQTYSGTTDPSSQGSYDANANLDDSGNVVTDTSQTTDPSTQQGSTTSNDSTTPADSTNPITQTSVNSTDPTNSSIDTSGQTVDPNSNPQTNPQTNPDNINILSSLTNPGPGDDNNYLVTPSEGAIGGQAGVIPAATTNETDDSTQSATISNNNLSDPTTTSSTIDTGSEGGDTTQTSTPPATDEGGNPADSTSPQATNTDEGDYQFSEPPAGTTNYQQDTANAALTADQTANQGDSLSNPPEQSTVSVTAVNEDLSVPTSPDFIDNKDINWNQNYSNGTQVGHDSLGYTYIYDPATGKITDNRFQQDTSPNTELPADAPIYDKNGNIDPSLISFGSDGVGTDSAGNKYLMNSDGQIVSDPGTLQVSETIDSNISQADVNRIQTTDYIAHQQQDFGITITEQTDGQYTATDKYGTKYTISEQDLSSAASAYEQGTASPNTTIISVSSLNNSNTNYDNQNVDGTKGGQSSQEGQDLTAPDSITTGTTAVNTGVISEQAAKSFTIANIVTAPTVSQAPEAPALATTQAPVNNALPEDTVGFTVDELKQLGALTQVNTTVATQTSTSNNQDTIYTNDQGNTDSNDNAQLPSSIQNILDQNAKTVLSTLNIADTSSQLNNSIPQSTIKLSDTLTLTTTDGQHYLGSDGNQYQYKDSSTGLQILNQETGQYTLAMAPVDTSITGKVSGALSGAITAESGALSKGASAVSGAASSVLNAVGIGGPSAISNYLGDTYSGTLTQNNQADQVGATLSDGTQLSNYGYDENSTNSVSGVYYDNDSDQVYVQNGKAFTYTGITYEQLDPAAITSNPSQPTLHSLSGEPLVQVGDGTYMDSSHSLYAVGEGNGLPYQTGLNVVVGADGKPVLDADGLIQVQNNSQVLIAQDIISKAMDTNMQALNGDNSKVGLSVTYGDDGLVHISSSGWEDTMSQKAFATQVISLDNSGLTASNIAKTGLTGALAVLSGGTAVAALAGAGAIQGAGSVAYDPSQPVILYNSKNGDAVVMDSTLNNNNPTVAFIDNNGNTKYELTQSDITNILKGGTISQDANGNTVTPANLSEWLGNINSGTGGKVLSGIMSGVSKIAPVIAGNNPGQGILSTWASQNPNSTTTQTQSSGGLKGKVGGLFGKH